MTESTLSRPRLSREEFLSRALEVLSREGHAKIRIDRLVAELGVSKGSFYWHFEDRADFVARLARHWAGTSTGVVVSHLETLSEEPLGRLRALAEMVLDQNLNAWELAIRAWAAHEDGVAAVVREVDRLRLETIRELIARLGFSGRELEVRARLFKTYVNFDGATPDPAEPAERRARALRALEIITAS